MTLGAAAAARVRLIVWCEKCQHWVEPDPAEMAARYGAETPALDWRERLVCSRCSSRQLDMVMSGTERGSVTAGMRTPSPEPEPKRQTLTAPSASNRTLPGFKCRERAAPFLPRRSLLAKRRQLRPKSRRPSPPRDVAFRAN
jgi:hypothetical protein